MTFSTENFIYAMDLAAMCFYGFTGVLALKPERNDLINVILLGLIASCGGGATRDVLLDRPVFFIQDVNYLIAPLPSIVLVFYFYPKIRKINKLLGYLDGFGLALFVASATASVLNEGYEPIIAVVMGTCTGVFGGVLRDVVINRKPMIMGRTFYLTPTVIGAVICCLLMQIGLENIAIITSFLVVFLLRSASIKWDWYLPNFMLFKHVEEEE